MQPPLHTTSPTPSLLTQNGSILAHSPSLPTLTADDLASLSTLDAAVAVIAEVYDFCQHPYLLWMQAETTSCEAFRYSQVPFRFAVESFSQALAAVLARIPLLEARMLLAENVAEEHGHGNHLRSHKYTFRDYLCALGATETDLQTPCSTPVLAFNQSILTYCLTQSGEAGAALLGVIEYLYVGISATIARTIHTRGWVKPGSQSHYAVHEILDTEHAKDLLMLARPAWNAPRDVKHPLWGNRTHIAQSLLLGAHYFWSLYRDLQPPV